MSKIKSILLGVCTLLAAINLFAAQAQIKEFKNFPQGTDPEEVGKKVAQRYLEFPFRDFGGIDAKPANEIVYPEVCAWLGALRFAKITQNKDLSSQLEKRFYPLFGKQKEIVPKADHVDHSVFGSIPLEIYLQTKNESFYYLGIDFADRQWSMPKNTKNADKYQSLLDKGLTWQTRFWIDDMFMITTIQSQAYRASGDLQYINRAAYEMTLYLDSIQQPNGLFFHAGNAPFYWGRGNGWMAAGMTEILKILPKDNPHRERILSEYKKMMNTLKQYQKPDGMWGQLIDDPEAWSESSCTGMFTYSMLTGVKQGWLDAKIFAPVVRKAWIALVSYINENGDVRDVCEGTNTNDNRQFYLDRKKVLGDMHGQAPVLWCATAFME